MFRQVAAESDFENEYLDYVKGENLTNIPVLLNTSFNDSGEPIVESPYHAVKAFAKMDIDSMVIGDFIIDK